MANNKNVQGIISELFPGKTKSVGAKGKSRSFNDEPFRQKKRKKRKEIEERFGKVKKSLESKKEETIKERMQKRDERIGTRKNELAEDFANRGMKYYDTGLFDQEVSDYANKNKLQTSDIESQYKQGLNREYSNTQRAINAADLGIDRELTAARNKAMTPVVSAPVSSVAKPQVNKSVVAKRKLSKNARDLY